ncbi:DUF6431 domain-containing protein [Virgibacillus pantothenticus]|uniref:DUF6431 domain-containing protein n=1 Tax=Virgibacillus pantothenticus TaxID=1473 RepID=UPI001BCE0CC5|nr:DUF6431 domain-containing protein [Virgibacillus pantothenticus]
MIHLHDFKIDIFQYAANRKENEFPRLDRCPGCHCFASGNIHRHGYYWRYGIKEDEHIPLAICRYLCLACGITISILPSFLVPYFQYTLYMIFKGIKRYLNGELFKSTRQLVGQHIKRFYKKIHWIHSCFVHEGYSNGLSKNIKKEALKYMKMIQDTGISSFFRRSWGLLSSYFMGTLILPHFSLEKNNIHPT